MFSETFELHQNLWNSDGGTADRTPRPGIKALGGSAVDSVVEPGAQQSGRVCAAVCVRTTVKRKINACLNVNHVFFCGVSYVLLEALVLLFFCRGFHPCVFLL